MPNSNYYRLSSENKSLDKLIVKVKDGYLLVVSNYFQPKNFRDENIVKDTKLNSVNDYIITPIIMVSCFPSDINHFVPYSVNSILFDGLYYDVVCLNGNIYHRCELRMKGMKHAFYLNDDEHILGENVSLISISSSSSKIGIVNALDSLWSHIFGLKILPRLDSVSRLEYRNNFEY